MSYAERVAPDVAQMVSHGLLRRSDGYRLVWEASTPEAADRDIDSMLWADGTAAHDEATSLFTYVWSYLPANWQSDAGVPGSALADVISADFDMPDPIPIGGLVVGDCYVNPPAGESVNSFDRAECESGAVQVYWVEDVGLRFGDFPGENDIHGFATELCSERAGARYSVMSWGSADPWWWYPSAESWSSGNTTVTCGLER